MRLPAPVSQLDMMDLGPGRDDTFRYVLVYIELTTRYVWIRALASKEAVLVAREVGGWWLSRCRTRLSNPGSRLHPRASACPDLPPAPICPTYAGVLHLDGHAGACATAV